MSGRAGSSRTDVHGVLLLDKPVGLTSQGAVSRVRQLLAAAKAGHTGTLDPMAGGLLPVCLGEATKFARFLLDADKVYLATVKLGITTNTGDLEGSITATSPVTVGREQIVEVLRRFSGDILQTPPMYSAIKHAGKPLYKYAREGKYVERQPRMVRIHSIECAGFSRDELLLNVRCGKGTYVRVLAEDIGNALGCGGCLAGLVRTGVGCFNLAAAIPLQQLEVLDPAARQGQLLPVDALVTPLARIVLGEQQAARILTGRTVQSPHEVPAGAPVRVYGPKMRFLGVAMSDEEGMIVPRRLISTDAPEHDAREGAPALSCGETMLEKTNS